MNYDDILLRRLKALFALIRVRYTGQVVGIVSILSIKSMGISVRSIFAIASFLFLSIALFSFDDAHDHLSDQTVHPERPIPRGIYTINQVYFFGAISFCLGIFFAIGLTFFQFALFLVASILGLIIIFLKLNFILRALISSFMIFILFPFSMFINLKSILFGLIVALPHIAGSIAKDFLHLDGDEKIGFRPPPLWGSYIASSVLFINAGIIVLPILLNLVTWLYIPLIFPTLASCLLLGIKVIRRQYQKVYIYGGIGMLSALIAFTINI